MEGLLSLSTNALNEILSNMGMTTTGLRPQKARLLAECVTDGRIRAKDLDDMISEVVKADVKSNAPSGASSSKCARLDAASAATAAEEDPEKTSAVEDP